MLETKDILLYGKERGIFAKNGFNLIENDFYNSSQSNDHLNIHFAVFGNMLDYYEKDKTIKWIGTIGRGIIGYGVTDFKNEDLDKVRIVGLTGSGNDIKLLGKLYLAAFGLKPSKKQFSEATYDSDKYKLLNDKKIDLTFFKGNIEENSKKYTILQPIKNNNFYPYRTVFIEGKDIKSKDEINRFIIALEEIKKDILENKESFIEYLGKHGAKAIQNSKEGYYGDIVDSIKDIDIKPDKYILKDSFRIYLSNRRIKEKDFNLDGLILK
ncbi:MAG: hypothetical protein PHS92_05425 [Candidatus Gracilibacteria bacterium]|nr:hypothetical protein [Candidatus Gracilibacteria bacterium]